LVWFRLDLRLRDNSALAAAIDRGGPVIPVFIWAPEEEGSWPLGGASQWWLDRSLAALNGDLEKRGSRLIIRRGAAVETIRQLAAESGASAVFWNRRYEPASIARDRQVKATLRDQGIAAESFQGNLLLEPWTILNASGEPFRIFTAFWRACQRKCAELSFSRPISDNTGHRLPPPEQWPHTLDVAELCLAPVVAWDRGLRETWEPGEAGAMKQVERFRNEALQHYSEVRDQPFAVGTSRLSPHLHFGEISPQQLWRTCGQDGGEAYLRQICWREFAYYLLYHFPQSAEEPLRREFGTFPWKADPKNFKAWTQGKTGYPLVDAGMRELWHTGWMHNRVRMVAASFLVKHLLIGWQEGAAWFWDTLVDADLANNTLGWQWVAGCGADAAPYFRIFNPVLQGEKFDPSGAYVRRWVPELAGLSDEWIHKPWQAPASVKVDSTYSCPVIAHEAARARALNAFRSMATIRR